jgi:hypothetical protein
MSIKLKYLTAETLIEFFKDIDNTKIIPMSTDSYNETLILERIQETGKKTELAACALNMSIVGFGNKKYGHVMHNGELLNIENVLKSCGVQLRNEPNKVLKDDDLTPQRICRFFRHNTQKFLRDNKYQSYMFRKYSDHDPQFFDICFRGAEYLDELTLEQKNYLLKVAKTMDAKINTNVADRMTRVFEAKLGLQFVLQP